MNIKAQEENFILFLFSGFAILFLLTIFVVYVVLEGKIGESFGVINKEIKFEGDLNNDYFLALNFLNFLDSEISYKDENITIRNLINEDEDKLFTFKLEAMKFFQDKININNSKAWIRIYSRDEDIRQFSNIGDINEKYQKYDVYFENNLEVDHCDPTDLSSTVFIHHVNLLKVVFCIENEK